MFGARRRRTAYRAHANPAMRLLLGEDDAMIGATVLRVLRAQYYGVDWLRDGGMAEQALRTAEYELVLLDLGLP